MKTSARIRFLATSMLVAGAAILEYCSGAAAQPAASNPADELRPLYANAADVAEGKRLADASCSGCHGQNGISASPGVPSLAGQRPAYIYIELKAYQSGTRGVGPMTEAVRFLSNDALINAAAYFASLEPAQPSAAGGSGAPAVDPIQAGRTATAACGGCHGETGISRTPGIPSLVALDPQYLVAAMKAYKSGQRKNDTMTAMLASTSDASLNTIALYYALQKPARAQTPAPGDAAAGAAAAAGCTGCHGDKGTSANPAIPSLAGQDAEYLAAALAAYKGGARNDDTMKGIAALSESAIKNMLAYYAAQEPQPPDVRKPSTSEEWAQKCDRCHGVNGNSTDPRWPALAGQRADYLEKVLHAYKAGERKSPQMAAMAEGLTDDEIKILQTIMRAKGRAPPSSSSCRASENHRNASTPGTAGRDCNSPRNRTMKHTLSTTTAIVALLAMVGIAHAAGDAGAGKAKAAACAGCHGANGEGSGPNPALAGKPEAQLVQAMKDFKSGKRDNAMMKGMVAALSDADLGNLAAYYASLKK